MKERTLACSDSVDKQLLPSGVTEDLAVGFKALGDPHRVAMVDLLLQADEPVCVVDIERHVPLAQSTVSYHLKFLVDAGVLERERRGRWMYYQVKPECLERLEEALCGFLERARVRA